MKKIISLLLVGVGLLSGGISVDAKSFKDGDTTYVLEERDLSCLGDVEYFLDDIDENNNLIFSVGENIWDLIKVNEKNECIEMSVEEKLYYLNLPYLYYRVIEGETDYDIVKDIMYYRPSVYIKTTDTEVDEDKQYYERMGDSAFGSILEPVKEDLSTYYEEVYMELPMSAEIDENITYYTYGSSGIVCEVVENPKKENILDYLVISDNQEIENYEKVSTLSKDIFGELFENSGIIEIIKSKDKDEFYVLVGEQIEVNEEESKIVFDGYTTSGEKIEILEDINYLQTYHNSLFGVTKDDILKIYNSDWELVYEDEEIFELYEIGYNNNIYYMGSWSNNIDDSKVYNMYEYKLLEGNNQIYNNKDLVFTFSGLKDKVTKVLVNDNELEEKNYTLESGSTIVTLKKDYLSSLDKGTYILSVVYGDITVNSSFIVEISNPNTFNGISYYLVLGIVSVVGLVVLAVCLRRKSS